MEFKLFFRWCLSFSILTGTSCTPAGCGCRPACSPPQPCAPVVPIMLDNCGPNPCPLPPINAPPVQAPLVNKPPVRLPACVPPTKTIANSCHCVKTVVKPQVVQQLITVPTIQRYIQTTHTPVVENIVYHGVPINCPPYGPEPPVPAAAPCAAPVPPPCVAPAKPPTPPALPPSLLALLTLAAPRLPPAAPCLPLAKPPALPPSLLSLLALAAKSPCPPPCPPPCAPPCLPPCPPPCPPPCLPCLAAAPPPTPLTITLPPCLLSLLSKLM